ncbi:uncharacterized protein LOC122381812 isoform X2 [Amphibalanus amphitrite]|uniref:uncharacterized protein LOC122381812 isoform X2 n=1 Tax=Amphibalanus amphitrite TaxID=1232801 RepID=UPI001C927412|nr:uncharacterized protein LOC122381812 isoform X2 [Amphibalanus amphitrite]
MRRSSKGHRLASCSTSDLVRPPPPDPARGRAGSICTSLIERDPVLMVALTNRLTVDDGQRSRSSWARETGWLRWVHKRADSLTMETSGGLLRGKGRPRLKTASDTTGLGGLRSRDWGAAQRTSAEPHWLSLEGLNLEIAEELEDEMTSQPATSRQQLLEEVLQTKELLQNKQRHKNSGGWTMTTAEVLNAADREERQVQMEAYRQQVQLRQRKMSAALKAQSPVGKTLSEAATCDLSTDERRELEQRLQSLESHIRQSELCARDTVTQIRSRRRQQLRTMQDLGVVDPSLAVDAAAGHRSAATTPTGAGEGASGDWEESVTLRRPRSLHSPSLTRRRTPLRFISNLGRRQRRSVSEWEEPAPQERPAETGSPLRSQVSPAALQEISRFERMMEDYLHQHQQRHHQLTAAPLRRRAAPPIVQQCL